MSLCVRADVMGVFLSSEVSPKVVIMLPGWPHAILCVFPCLCLFVRQSEMHRVTFFCRVYMFYSRAVQPDLDITVYNVTFLRNMYQMPSLLLTLLTSCLGMHIKFCTVEYSRTV